MSDFTYDVSTNVGKVRALIGDTSSTAPLLTDTEITALLSLRGNDVFLAASICLHRIAANKALLARRIVAGNYSEDATAMAKELREQAKAYDEIAKSVPAEAQSEQFFTDFAYRDLLVNKILRDETD